jgi:hypothetical protein
LVTRYGGFSLQLSDLGDGVADDNDAGTAGAA